MCIDIYLLESVDGRSFLFVIFIFSCCSLVSASVFCACVRACVRACVCVCCFLSPKLSLKKKIFSFIDSFMFYIIYIQMMPCNCFSSVVLSKD